MFIAHVIGSLDPGLGGPPQVAVALASVQQSRGHRVAIVHRGGDDRAALIQEYGKNPGFEGVTSIPTTAGWPGAFRGLDGPVAEQLREADVLHIHGVWEPLLAAAAATAWRQGTPYTITPHGMLDPWSLGQKRLKKSFAMRLVFRKVLGRATFIHVLTEDEAGHVALLGNTSPARVIPNGVDKEILHATGDGTTFRAQHPALGDAPYVLFMARLHHKKGIDRLVAGFTELATRRPDAHLVLAGPEDGAGDAARTQVKAEQLTSRVHFVGPIYGEMKQSAIRGAACFALPSRQEGFSVALLEALGAGCPIVISEACHFARAQDAGAGRVTDTAPQPLADAMEHYIANPAEAQEAGQRGIALIREDYTWDAVAAQLDEAYAQAVADAPTPPSVS